MEKAKLTTQQILSGDFDKYTVRIGNDKYYTETTVLDYKAALHFLRSFKNAFGEPQFAMIGTNPKYKSEHEKPTVERFIIK